MEFFYLLSNLRADSQCTNLYALCKDGDVDLNTSPEVLD